MPADAERLLAQIRVLYRQLDRLAPGSAAYQDLVRRIRALADQYKRETKTDGS